MFPETVEELGMFFEGDDCIHSFCANAKSHLKTKTDEGKRSIDMNHVLCDARNSKKLIWGN